MPDALLFRSSIRCDNNGDRDFVSFLISTHVYIFLYKKVWKKESLDPDANMDFTSPKLLYQLRWCILFLPRKKIIVFTAFLHLFFPISAFPSSSEDLRSSTFQSAPYLRFLRSKSGRGTFPKRHVNVNHRNDESKTLEILTNENR